MCTLLKDENLAFRIKGYLDFFNYPQIFLNSKFVVLLLKYLFFLNSHHFLINREHLLFIDELFTESENKEEKLNEKKIKNLKEHCLPL